MNPRNSLIVGGICAAVGTAVAAFGAHALANISSDLSVAVRAGGFGCLLFGVHCFQRGMSSSANNSAPNHWLTLTAQIVAYVLATLGAVSPYFTENPGPSVTGLAYLIPLFLLPVATRNYLHQSKGKVGISLIEVGALIFGLTLQGISYLHIRALGAITPIGGVCMILGWAFLSNEAYSNRSETI